MESDTEVITIPKLRRSIYTTYANFPSTNLTPGDFAYATDRLVLYRWSGAAWEPIAIHLQITSGTYTGDNTVNRAIAHGLGATPQVVMISEMGGSLFRRILSGVALIYFGTTTHIVTVMDGTNFYVGNAASYIESANSGLIWYWIAFG